LRRAQVDSCRRPIIGAAGAACRTETGSETRSRSRAEFGGSSKGVGSSDEGLPGAALVHESERRSGSLLPRPVLVADLAGYWPAEGNHPV